MSRFISHKSNHEQKIIRLILQELLEKVGEKARSLSHRPTFHPDNTMLLSPNESVENTKLDLGYHAEVLI